MKPNKRKTRACKKGCVTYEKQDGHPCSFDLDPHGVRIFLKRIGASRKRVRKEIVRLFRYGKTIRAFHVTIKPAS